MLREQASGLDCVTLAASLRPPLPFAPLCLAPVFNQFNASRVATNSAFFVLTWTCVSFARHSGDQFWSGWLSNCPNKSTRRSQPHFAPFGPKVPASKKRCQQYKRSMAENDRDWKSLPKRCLTVCQRSGLVPIIYFLIMQLFKRSPALWAACPLLEKTAHPFRLTGLLYILGAWHTELNRSC